MRKNIFALLGFLVLLSAGVYAQGTNEYGMKVPALPFNPNHYVCYKTSAPLKIDGLLNEPAWKAAEWTSYFKDIEGDVRPEPRYKTRAKMLWDDKYLYIAAEIQEPHIQAKLQQRDTIIFYDNDFEIFIDPNGDTHGYYEFEMNALNTVWDLLLVKPYRDDAPVINSWNINGLKSAVKIYGTINKPKDTDDKWVVELAYPLNVLKEFNSSIPKDGDQWRINFSRVEWKTKVENGRYVKEINPESGKPYPEDNWVWSPQGVVNMHFPEMWGFLQFTDKEAGTASVPFVYNPEEDVKWELRNLYYAQREYSAKFGQYASTIRDLEKVGLLSNALKFRPELKNTMSLYEIIAGRSDSKFIWHIDQSGRTWNTVK
ncbi:MAG: carbohydrate-binding family 9-like protein [Bacteroidota bacterium]|nr:carbohydrate-binding family 9-like protein [Bacteroidota bacterium]